MQLKYLVPALALVLGVGVTAVADPKPDAKQTETDLEAFRAYLKEHYREKKWQTGPTRIDSDEIRKAYPGQRFYFVFSAPPLPPGAPLPEVLKSYQKRMEEFRKDYLALTVRIDAAGKISALQKAADYNAGLMKVATDEDAKIAAAAVVALCGQDRVGPGAVAANEVRVTKNEQGWTCTVSKPRTYQATAAFDPAGRCLRVSKHYAGPLPP